MKSIPLIGTLIGVLLMKASSAVEATETHDVNAQLADSVRAGVENADRLESASDGGATLYALASRNSDRINKAVSWSTEVLNVTVPESSADDRTAVRSQQQRAETAISRADPISSEDASGNLDLLSSGLAVADGQYFLSSSSLGGSGGQSASMQAASSAALFALQSTIGSWNEHYEYDALGRLTKVTFASGAVTNYTLDNAGNRTNVNTTVP